MGRGFQTTANHSADGLASKRTEQITLPVLTLRQPWASLIMFGGKTIENRNWSPPKRLVGQRLAIHAGKKCERLYERIDDLDLADPIDRALRKCLDLLGGEHWPRGAILGTVELVGYGDRHNPDLTDAERDWFDGPVGWILRDPRPLSEPIPAQGKQGLWNFEINKDLLT